MPHKHAVVLLVLIIAGVIGGALCGWFFGPAIQGIAWIGTLFLNALKMIIVPLIVAAMISGVASLGDVRKLGRLGGITVLYCFSRPSAALHWWPRASGRRAAVRPSWSSCAASRGMSSRKTTDTQYTSC